MCQFNYIVQPADFQNWAELHQLLTRCFKYMDGRIDPPSSLQRMSAQTLRCKAQEEILVIVIHGGQLVACGFLKIEKTALYLGKLAVDPAFRNQGILRSIIAIAEDIARQHGKSALELQTRVELIENHATFTALGFVKTGEQAHPGYHRPTSITMRKTLTA